MPPPVVALGCAGLARASAGSLPQASFEPPAATLVGGGLLLAGLMLNLLPKMAFSRTGTTVNPLHPQRTAALVTSGLHRLSRNPMYLGHAILLAGVALLLGNALAFIAVPSYVVWVERFQIRPEERALRARFGEAYDDYCQRVRRWI